MKYIKKFESIKVEKKKGVYVTNSEILSVIDNLKEKDIKFMLLFGTDDDTDDECFLVLIENDDYKKLKHTNDFGVKDYYIEINGNNVFFNWFIPEEIEGNWQIIRDTSKENIETILNSKKYNI